MSKPRNAVDKAVELRIEQSYRRGCAGVQIDILDIPKVFARGRDLIAKGIDDSELDKQLALYVGELIGARPHDVLLKTHHHKPTDMVAQKDFHDAQKEHRIGHLFQADGVKVKETVAGQRWEVWATR